MIKTNSAWGMNVDFKGEAGNVNSVLCKAIEY